MQNIITIFKRELSSYFATPVAYVFIVIFLIMSGALTFYLGNYFERGQADLNPFFQEAAAAHSGRARRHAL